MKNSNFTYMDVLLITVSVLLGVNTAVMKLGYRYIPPYSFNAIRLIFAVIFAWGVVFATRSYRKVDKEDIKRIFLVCFIVFPVLQLCLVAGTSNTPAGTAALILAMVPISVVVINRLLKIEKITGQTVVGIVASFLGVLLIVIGSGKSLSVSSNSIFGILFLLVTQLCFAIYMVFTKDLFKKYSIYQITAYAVTGSAFFTLIFNFKNFIAVDWASVSIGGWWTTLYAGIIGMCVCNFLWSLGVKKVGSTRTAIYNNLPPVFTIIVGYFYLSELLSLVQFLGALSIFIGLYIAKFGIKLPWRRQLAEEKKSA